MFTVKELVKISGVSIRTLHYYDEIGLLKPAYYGENGYRYYGESELFRLQQILFFRELGFALKKIMRILDRPDFDKMIALTSHKQVLQKNLERTQNLITTIDKTVKHLKGSIKMQEHEIYWGFDIEQQKTYENELIQRFGDQAKEAIAESTQNLSKWGKEEWQRSKQDCSEICKELTLLLKQGALASSGPVQLVIRRHYEWLKQFWTPDRGSYAGLGEIYQEDRFRKVNFDSHHPKLADFMSEAMHFFAQHSEVFNTTR